MPGPSSETTSALPDASACTSTRTVDVANLPAFSSRFATTWATRSASTEARWGPGPTTSSNESPARSISCSNAAQAGPTTSARSVTSRCRENCLASKRARSSRSATRRSSRCASRRITCAAATGSSTAPVLDRLRVAADRGQRGAQVVGHRHEELLRSAAGPRKRLGHLVDRPGQVTELVAGTGRRFVEAQRQVTAGDATGREVDLAQRPRDPPRQDERHQDREHDDDPARDQHPADRGGRHRELARQHDHHPLALDPRLARGRGPHESRASSRRGLARGRGEHRLRVGPGRASHR